MMSWLDRGVSCPHLMGHAQSLNFLLPAMTQRVKGQIAQPLHLHEDLSFAWRTPPFGDWPWFESTA